jgi:hypothetical protein
VWALLCFAAVGIAFIFAIAVPIFSDIISLTAALFAAWYTYGIAGFFWLHDTYYLKGKWEGLKQRWMGTTVAVLTVLAGAFISVAGTFVSIKVSRPALSVTISKGRRLPLLAHSNRIQYWSCRETLLLSMIHICEIHRIEQFDK